MLLRNRPVTDEAPQEVLDPCELPAELTAMRRKLAAIPDAPPELVEVMLRTARLQVYVRLVAEHQAECVTALQAASAEALESGDLTVVSAAALAVVASDIVAQKVPAFPDASESISSARTHLSVRLNQAVGGDYRRLTALDYNVEVQSWRRMAAASRDNYAQPIYSTEDATAVRYLKVAEAALSEWDNNVVAWRGWWDLKGIDPLDLLASGASLCAQAPGVVTAVTAANASIEQANVSRRSAGLTWRRPAS